MEIMEEKPLQELKQGFRNRIRTLTGRLCPVSRHAARHKSAEFLSVSPWVLRKGAKTAIRPSQDDSRHPYRSAFCRACALIPYTRSSPGAFR